MTLPRLLLTPGEPAGIGPELLVQLVQTATPAAALIAVADPDLLSETAARLGLPLKLHDWQPGMAAAALPAAELHVWATSMAVPALPGRLDVRNAPYVLLTLRRAADACLAGDAAALVTGPVHKGVIADSGVAFSGHTEFLAAHLGAPPPVMLLMAANLRVALATTHLPLSEVPRALTRETLTHCLSVLHRELVVKFGLASPRILVASLNPHAGEGGHLGREEIEVITPVLTALRASGMDLLGPLPADTLFTPRTLEGADAVLAMYHDQGLPVLKHVGFGHAVNVTLGLPIIRTSVDHGVALDLVGTGRADAGSLRAALVCALDIHHRQAA